MNFRFLLITFILSLSFWDTGALMAQSPLQSPNCSNFSPAIDEQGNAEVSAGDFLTNANNTSFPVTVEVKNKWGGTIKTFVFDNISDIHSWKVCEYLGQSLEYTASNSIGNCRLGKVDLNGTPAVILTSAWSASSSDPSVGDNKKVVYCGNIPSPSSHKPKATAPCGGSFQGPKEMPDWVVVNSCGDSDTAEVIWRHWEVIDKYGQRTTMTDTIIVMRLPKLSPGAFLGSAKDSFYCDLKAHPQAGEDIYRYAAWKQPVGIADFEQPYSGLGAIVYNIPGYVIEAGLYNACQQGTAKYNSYLNTVIMKNPDNTTVRIRDIISGNYMTGVLSRATPTQLGYGILNQIYEGFLDAFTTGGYSSCSGGSYTFYNYLFPVIGSEVLSEDGSFETVTEDWFYNGTGNTPYWFSGGWPSIYGTGDCVSYCDVHSSIASPVGSVQVTVPRLIADGTSAYGEECQTITISESTKCGLKIERASDDWEASVDCMKERGGITTITQTCWASVENHCAPSDAPVGDTCLVVDYQDNEACCGRVIITLNKIQQIFDTLPPVFEFCYPNTGTWEIDGEEIAWDLTEVERAIRNGEQYPGADAWERNNPSIYSTGSHDCEAEVYVPDIVVSDNCTGVKQMNAVVHFADETFKKVSMIPTDTVMVQMGGGQVCTLYTYSHTKDPIRIPFNGCDGDLIQVVYSATDGCNTSTWNKYIQIVDDVPPTAVTNRNVNVNVGKKIELVNAIESYDNGSWDNCAIDLMLARRSDWASDTACVILCWDETKSYNNWADILADLGVDRMQANAALHGGKVGVSEFTAKYDVDALSKLLNKGEVENYYFEQIKSLWERNNQCNDKVVHGWIFDLARHLSYYWDTGEDDSFDLGELERIFDNLFDAPGYGYEIAQLGGGWAEYVPFSCADACKIIPTELLVVDYCCNWSIGSTETHLQEKSPAVLVAELPDLTVSCEAYNLFYKDIVDEASKLNSGGGSASDTSGVFGRLDDAFGKYIMTWVDNQGRPIDINENLLPQDSLRFTYHTITCGEESVTKDVLTTDKEGNEIWTKVTEKVSYQDTIDKTAPHGIVGINCYSTYTQDVIIEMDVCGQGRIIRRFFIEGGCGENEEIKREVRQVIHVESSCRMQESMFDVPVNLGGKDHPICLPQALGDDYLPDTIGYLQVKDHLFGKLCNSIAISKSIQAQKIVGYPDLVQFVITWKATDWCCAEALPEREYEFLQKVIATIDPDCNVDTEGPGSAGLVYGKIETDLGKAVKEVEVKAVLGNGSPMTTVTQMDGTYRLSVRKGASASVIPAKNTGFAEGITTEDLIHIQRHLLKKEILENPYQRIAADVNANGAIDVFDLIELRKLVMNPEGEFANNTSWRFFEKSTGEEVLELPQMPEEKPVDWVGVKIGDVNQSGEIIRSNRHITGELSLKISDKELKGGETYRIPVRSDDFADVMGMQYTLSYLPNQVEVESIEAGALNITENNYYRFAPGVITSSWSEADGQSLSSDAVLFTIVLKAKSSVQLRDALSLNSRVTPVEAYAADGLKDVSLRFDGGDDNEFALFQNTPNPFNGQTVIGFNLPTASKATLSIYDVTGKMLKVIEGEYDQGYHEVNLKGSDLNATGVLYYQLDTKTYTATKKMILIE